jgi:hypothetical protein
VAGSRNSQQVTIRCYEVPMSGPAAPKAAGPASLGRTADLKLLAVLAWEQVVGSSCRLEACNSLCERHDERAEFTSYQRPSRQSPAESAGLGGP